LFSGRLIQVNAVAVIVLASLTVPNDRDGGRRKLGRTHTSDSVREAGDWVASVQGKPSEPFNFEEIAKCAVVGDPLRFSGNGAATQDPTHNSRTCAFK
jgi:hypothetical protein